MSKQIKRVSFLITLLAVFFSLSFFIKTVQATETAPAEQSQAILVADVNFYSAKIISQNEGNLKIKFTLGNGEKVQPGIQYGIQILQKKDKSNVLIEEKIFKEKITLGEKKETERTITYQPPSFLKGDYYIQLVSYNQEGVLLAMWLFDQPVTLSGSGQYVELKNCYLHVKGLEADTGYELQAGVDIATGEQLQIICDTVNHWSKDISANTNYEIFERSISSGRKISEESGQTFDFGAGKEETIKFDLVQGKNPQAYDTKFFLVNSDNKIISNSVVAHYVVRGESATIQNILFDKKQYKVGDTLRVSFLVSGNAGNFPNARHQADSEITGSINLALKDKNGKICAQKTVPINNINEEPLVKMDLIMKQNCSEPSIYATLIDNGGKALYKTDMPVELSFITKPTKEKFNFKKNIAFIVSIILIALLLLFLAWRYFKDKGKGKGVAMFLILFSAVCFLGFYAHGASASTYHFFYDHMTITVNWPAPGNYSAGSSVHVQAGIPFVWTCGNRIFTDTEVRCGINGNRTTVKSVSCGSGSCPWRAGCRICGDSSLGTSYFSVPSTCNQANHLICDLHVLSHEPGNPDSWSTQPIGSVSLGTVHCSTPPSCNLSFSSSSIVVPGSSTATWSSSSNATKAKYSCTGLISDSGSWGSIGTSGSRLFSFNSSQIGTEQCTVTVKNSAGVTGSCTGSVNVTAPSYHCTNSIPANASAWSNETSGLSGNLTWQHSSSDTSRKCQFHCNSGYNWNGHSCAVPPPPPPASCGSNAQTYSSSIDHWPSTSNSAFCSSGSVNPSTPTFPAQGSTITWTCHSSDTAHCSASRQKGFTGIWKEVAP